MRNDVALLVLRLCGLFLALGHGWGKLVMLAAGDGQRFVEGVARLGFPAPAAFAWAAALAECAGGLCVALGLATRCAAAFAGLTMLVAAFFRHHAHHQLLLKLGLMSASAETVDSWGNPELALVYLLVMLALAVTGGGGFALDSFIRKRR